MVAHVTDDACRHTGSNRSVQRIRINLTHESINSIRSADLDSQYSPGEECIGSPLYNYITLAITSNLTAAYEGFAMLFSNIQICSSTQQRSNKTRA